MRARASSRVAVAIYGPTSAGKTGLSIELALRLGPGVEVVSADSRQVYRHMDVGTSKVTPGEARGVPHRMLDVAEPVRKLELEAYAAGARSHLAACLDAGGLPLVVGGTGIYVRSLLDAWEVAGTAAIRRELERDFPPALAADAHRLLRRLDREAAARVSAANHEAVLNALVRAHGRPSGGRPAPAGERVRWLVLGIDPGAPAVDRAVARTFDGQLERGLLDEVAGLAARYRLDEELRRRGRRTDNQVLRTHGYREFFEIAAERGRTAATLTAEHRLRVRELVLDHIRAYTRRQRGWYPKLPGLRLVTGVDEAHRAVLRARCW